MSQYIAYSVASYFTLLLVSAALAFEPKFKKSLWIFIFANIVGFAGGLAYFAGFFGKQLVLFDFDWFFNFKPTLNLLSAIFFTLISGISALVGIYSIKYLDLYKKVYSKEIVQFLMALFVVGMQGVLFANNSFVFLFFWEVMSISSFFLVMSDKSQHSIKASFLYLIMTHLGASAILGGFLILGNGDLFFEFQSLGITAASLSPMMTGLAFALFLFGFGSKAGLVPFHVWLPEAHPQAPSNISAMMSGLMLKVAVYGFILVAFKFTNLPMWASLVVLALGIMSAFLGALNAAIEKDLKRAFAYSSIENMGIIFIMLGLALFVASHGKNELNVVIAAILAYAIFHAINHAFFKTALFLSSGIIISRVHDKNMNVMGGLAKIMPVFSFVFLLAILGSLPIAPFGTFFSEWGLIQNIITLLGLQFAVSSKLIFIFILSVIGIVGGLAVFAMVKIFAASMLGLPRAKHLEKHDEKADYFMIAPILTLAFGVLALGFFASPILRAIMNKSESFLAQETINDPVILVSPLVFGVIASVLVLVIAAKKIFIKKQKERIYHTWDCGQPIDATMEYTASAFSAPIRFFFLNFVGREKNLLSTAVIETNPWIRKYTFNLVLKSVWQEKIYAFIADFVIGMAEKIKKIQSGRIQYYLLFLLFTLIVTLMIVL